jgi:hypothetical protein
MSSSDNSSTSIIVRPEWSDIQPQIVKFGDIQFSVLTEGFIDATAMYKSFKASKSTLCTFFDSKPTQAMIRELRRAYEGIELEKMVAVNGANHKFYCFPLGIRLAMYLTMKNINSLSFHTWFHGVLNRVDSIGDNVRQKLADIQVRLDAVTLERDRHFDAYTALLKEATAVNEENKKNHDARLKTERDQVTKLKEKLDDQEAEIKDKDVTLEKTMTQNALMKEELFKLQKNYHELVEENKRLASFEASRKRKPQVIVDEYKDRQLAYCMLKEENKRSELAKEKSRLEIVSEVLLKRRRGDDVNLKSN